MHRTSLEIKRLNTTFLSKIPALNLQDKGPYENNVQILGGQGRVYRKLDTKLKWSKSTGGIGGSQKFKIF